MVVKDGALVNQTSYEPSRRIHSTRFVGRKNMLISHNIDGIDRLLRLIIKTNSVIPTDNSVSFNVKDFNDGYHNDSKRYDVKIEAVQQLDDGWLEIPYTPIELSQSILTRTSGDSQDIPFQFIWVAGSQPFVFKPKKK